MKDFKKSSSFGGRGTKTGGFGRPAFGGSRGYSRPPSGFKKSDMHDATCSNCNKKCSVPFLPNGKKPVFCTDCHVSAAPARDTERPAPRKEFSSRSSFSSRPSFDSSRGSDDTVKQLATLNKKMDTLIEKIDALLSE